MSVYCGGMSLGRGRPSIPQSPYRFCPCAVSVCPWTVADCSILQSPYHFRPCTVSVCPWAGADRSHPSTTLPFVSLYCVGYPWIAADCSVPQFLYRLCPCIVCSNIQTEAEFQTDIRTRHRLNIKHVTATCGWLHWYACALGVQSRCV